MGCLQCGIGMALPHVIVAYFPQCHLKKEEAMLWGEGGGGGGGAKEVRGALGARGLYFWRNLALFYVKLWPLN